MPYKIVSKDGKFLTVNKQTGKVNGTHATKAQAEAQMRLLEGIEHGWKPSGK